METKRCCIGSLGILDLTLGVLCFSGIRVNEEFIPCFSCSCSCLTIALCFFCITHSIGKYCCLIQTVNIKNISKHYAVSRNSGKVITKCTSLTSQSCIFLLITVLILVGHWSRSKVIYVCINVINVVFYNVKFSCLHIQVVRNSYNQAVPGNTKALSVVRDLVICFQIISYKCRAILGRHSGLTAVRANSIHPLAHEVVSIGYIRTRQCINLRISGPSHTLVTLRAVCWNGNVVAGCGVCDVCKQLVGQLIGGLILSACIQRGKYLHLDAVCRKLLIKACDLNVTISVEGKIR